MPVNVNEYLNQSKSKYLCLLIESMKKWTFASVNGINKKVNICAC